MSEAAFDVGAPRPGVGATIVPATVTVVATAAVVQGAAIALIAAIMMAVAVRQGRRRLHTIGGALAFGGVMLAAAAGIAPVLALVGGAAAIVAWDTGEHAIGLGMQVGHEAEARRPILVHAAASALAATVIVLVAAGVYVLALGGQPGPAAAILAVAVGLFAWLLDR